MCGAFSMGEFDINYGADNHRAFPGVRRMSMNIAVIGSYVTDFIFRAPRRPVKGETIIGTGFELAMGGKGANQAMMAALLGANVSMIGRVGKDQFGDQQLENMAGAGVNTDFTARDERQKTGCSGIIVDQSGDNSIVFTPGANNRMSREDIDRATPALEGADTVLLQLELPFKLNSYAIKKVHKMGKRVILDPAPACALEEHFYECADIMTPNETEAAILSGVDVADVESAEKAAREIAARGCETVIITLGENGALLLDQGQAQHFPPVAIKAVDTTAAGDAFTGSLAVFLAQGKELAEAVQLACLAGALSATKLGAQPSLPTLEEFEKFKQQNLIM